MRVKLKIPAAMNGRVWLHEPRDRPTHYPTHSHAELELNLVLRGSGSYLVGDRRVDLSPGSLLWLFPDHEHVLLSRSPDFVMWIGVFKPALVHRACSRPESALLRKRNPSGVHVSTLSKQSVGHLDRLFAEVMRSASDTDRLNAGLAYALLTAWAEHLDAQKPAPFGQVHPAVERAAHTLRDGAWDLSLAQLAQRCNISAARLSRLFKAQTGVSLVAFRSDQRIERFLRLTQEESGQTLIALALEAGFGSYAQFHRAFRKAKGVAPAQYLRQRSPSSA
jgi:AraC-like DNA-binding protein